MQAVGKSKPRVLVVDDHPMVREGIRSMLSGEVAAWAEAGTGAEALKRAAEVNPDLVLLDVQLPDLDGLTVLRQIKELAPRASVLIVTMHDNPAYVHEAVKLGAAGYVLKGISRRELLATVHAVCEGESVIEPPLLRRLLGEVGGPPLCQTSREALTRVEREVLALLTQGLTNGEIARRLRWSLGTVKKYVQRVFEKLGVSDRTQAAVEAVRRGLLG